MTEDQAKAPRAKCAAPPMPLLDRQIAQAKQRVTLAKTEDLRRFHAEQVVGLRFERGDFPMIQLLDDATRRALVKAMLEKAPE